MILVDSSAWVEYDRATGSPVHLRVRELIEQDGPIATSEPVLMEVLAGARTDRRRRDLRRLLLRCSLRPLDPVADFESAARLYRRCRAVGVTPRGLIDCLIAAVALRHGDSLLAHDVDLARIAAVVGVPLDLAAERS